MNEHDHGSAHETPTLAGKFSGRWKVAACMVGVIVAFYVLREHWGHVLGYAPYLILLACPFMHIFMHHGHGHGQHSGGEPPEKK